MAPCRPDHREPQRRPANWGRTISQKSFLRKRGSRIKAVTSSHREKLKETGKVITSIYFLISD
jgi:hypothetical protein